ncbi:LCP family protein [Listeria cornellensis]|uniref:Putative transcriptional regulator, LytR family protein n=1 Tax=Listeria cornellensis FSL F6-0969 TaxID=1265820 RepID=W7C8B3_9LIST|nr:LCP family protein [Listeria cornellensis]EUJ31921.1 putative transcriptional regulator, LytR family protein [Listeria cornellensis FSL F6-0969]
MDTIRFQPFEKKASKRTQRLQISFVILLGIAFTLGAFAIHYYNGIQQTLNLIHVPLSKDKASTSTLTDGHAFSILMIGTDARAGEKNGRSDSMILATINKEKNSVKMLSIPRDTKVTYDDGAIGKINGSYSKGGAEGTVKAVEGLMNVPIDYYVTINMEGFSDLVSAVGGVRVTNDIDLTEVNKVFVKDKIDLTGKQALQYVRIRHEDPRGDFGRQDRQRDVIMGISNELAGTASITHFKNLLKAVGDNFTTNLAMDDITEIATKYASVRNDVKTLKMEGEGVSIYSEAYGFNLYYYEPDVTSKAAATKAFREHLGLTTE